MTTIYSSSRRNLQSMQDNKNLSTVQQPAAEYQLSRDAFTHSLDKVRKADKQPTIDNRHTSPGEPKVRDVINSAHQKSSTIFENSLAQKESASEQSILNSRLEQEYKNTVNINSEVDAEIEGKVEEEFEENQQESFYQIYNSAFSENPRYAENDKSDSDEKAEPESLLAVSDFGMNNMAGLHANDLPTGSVAIVDIENFLSMFNQLRQQQALSATQFLAEKKWHFSLQDSHLPIVGLIVSRDKSDKWTIALLSDETQAELGVLVTYSNDLKERFKQSHRQYETDLDINIATYRT